MGHRNSKHESSDESTDGSSSESSRVQRLPQRFRRHRRHFRLHRRGTNSDSTAGKLLKEGDFAGIALLRIISAKMSFKEKWLACVTLGEQTFRTAISDHTDQPIWNSTNRMSKNNLVGFCEIDLYDFLTQDSDSDIEVYDLLRISSPEGVVGKISLSCFIEDPLETEKSFARRILSIVDYNEDGHLSYSEFSNLIDAFGNLLAANKLYVQTE